MQGGGKPLSLSQLATLFAGPFGVVAAVIALGVIIGAAVFFAVGSDDPERAAFESRSFEDRASSQDAIAEWRSVIDSGAIAASLDEEVMRKVIGALMAVMLVMVLARPRRWLEGRPAAERPTPIWIQFPIFFAIGIYGGFIQAGVGIFLLAGLVLTAGYDLVRGNAVKILIILRSSSFWQFAGQRWGDTHPC